MQLSGSRLAPIFSDEMFTLLVRYRCMALTPSFYAKRIGFDRSVLGLSITFFLVNAILIAVVPLLPFIDLPNHLAEATVFKYYGAPDNGLDQYYKPVPWYYPNTFHALFCSWFPSVEAGNKVFHILYIALLQLALLLLVRMFNGNPWYGLLGLVFTYNYNLTFGFVGFAISIPVLLFLFFFILQDFRYDKLLWKFLIALSLLCLYFMHAQNALLGLLFYGVLRLIHHRFNLFKSFVKGLPVALPLIAFIASWWWLKDDPAKESTFDFLLTYYASEFWAEYPKRLYLAVLDNYSVYEGFAGVAVALLLSFSVLAPLIFFKALTKKAISVAWKGENRFLTVLFAASVACYFLLPERLPGQAPLYQRFSTIVMLSLVLIGSVLVREVDARQLKSFVVVLLCVVTIVWGEYLITFNRQNRDFNASFLKVDNPDDKLVGLIWDGEYRGRKVYIHFPNYYIVWHHGTAGSKIIDYRFGIVRRVVPESVLPFYQEYAHERFVPLMKYDPAEYFLARENGQTLTETFFPAARKVRQAGSWVIYRNHTPSMPAEYGRTLVP